MRFEAGTCRGTYSVGDLLASIKKAVCIDVVKIGERGAYLKHKVREN